MWTGRRGAVLLGPTEHRIARYLEQATRHGGVRIRTVDLASRTQLERSEAYRITARLRVLGLFGVRNDPSGSAGGRYWWRTAAARRDAQPLHAGRHRDAVRRIRGWTRRAHLEAMRRLEDLRISTAAPVRPPLGVREPFPLRRWMVREAPRLAAEWGLET